MTITEKTDARAGDWLECRGIHGETPRRGEIVEILGSAGHRRYRVRWDEHQESIVYPADGVTIIRHPGAHHPAGSSRAQARRP